MIFFEFAKGSRHDQNEEEGCSEVAKVDGASGGWGARWGKREREEDTEKWQTYLVLSRRGVSLGGTV